MFTLLKYCVSYRSKKGQFGDTLIIQLVAAKTQGVVRADMNVSLVPHV